MPDHQELRQRIVEMVKRQLEAYYVRHPERANDQRSKDANDASFNGLRLLFALLDQYTIISKLSGTEQNLRDMGPAGAGDDLGDERVRDAEPPRE